MKPLRIPHSEQEVSRWLNILSCMSRSQPAILRRLDDSTRKSSTGSSTTPRQITCNSGRKVGLGADTSLEYKIGEVLIYLDSDDIDATLATVEAHGGTTVVPRTEIAGHGWWAVFIDPSGNKIGLFGR